MEILKNLYLRHYMLRFSQRQFLVLRDLYSRTMTERRPTEGLQFNVTVKTCSSMQKSLSIETDAFSMTCSEMKRITCDRATSSSSIHGDMGAMGQ